MRFYVEVRETLIRRVGMEASSSQTAKQSVKQMYLNQNIVLTADDFSGDIDFRVCDSELNALEDWNNDFD